MTMVVVCNGCGNSLEIPDSAAGGQVLCANCGNTIEVPSAKRCAICYLDISQKKRIRDAAGNYYCEPCWAAKDATKRGGPVANNSPAALADQNLGTGAAPLPTSHHEVCMNCGEVIGTLERPFLWQQKLVCAKCWARLESNAVSIPKNVSQGISLRARPKQARAQRPILRSIVAVTFAALCVFWTSGGLRYCVRSVESAMAPAAGPSGSIHGQVSYGPADPSLEAHVTVRLVRRKVSRKIVLAILDRANFHAALISMFTRLSSHMPVLKSTTGEEATHLAPSELAYEKMRARYRKAEATYRKMQKADDLAFLKLRALLAIAESGQAVSISSTSHLCRVLNIIAHVDKSRYKKAKEAAAPAKLAYEKAKGAAAAVARLRTLKHRLDLLGAFTAARLPISVGTLDAFMLVKSAYLVDRFTKMFTHHRSEISNFFQRWTTGAALISAIP